MNKHLASIGTLITFLVAGLLLAPVAARAEGNGSGLGAGLGVTVDAPGVKLQANGRGNAWGQIKQAFREDREENKKWSKEWKEERDDDDDDENEDNNRRINLRGTINSVSLVSTSTGSFVVSAKNHGNVTVKVNADTVIRKAGAAATLSDLAAGQTVTVFGRWNKADNTVTASRVNVVMEWRPIFVRGTVTAKTDATLTLAGHSGTVYAVNVERGLIVGRFLAPAALTDIVVGDMVMVGGIRLNQSTDLRAFIVRDLTSASATP